MRTKFASRVSASATALALAACGGGKHRGRAPQCGREPAARRLRVAGRRLGRVRDHTVRFGDRRFCRTRTANGRARPAARGRARRGDAAAGERLRPHVPQPCRGRRASGPLGRTPNPAFARLRVVVPFTSAPLSRLPRRDVRPDRRAARLIGGPVTRSFSARRPTRRHAAIVRGGPRSSFLFDRENVPCV